MTPFAVITTVLGYIAVLFVVAWLSGRRADNAGFFTGNRSTPWYMAAFAMIGAAISGVTFISVPGSVAVDSFSYMQMVAGFTVGQLVVAFLLIPTFYRLRVVSLYEYLDGRFGILSHHTGAWFFFVSKMLGAALRVYVVCAVMQLLVFSHYGLPFWLNALVTMLFVWLYTQQGGVKSLIWTDTLKTFCLVGSLVLSIVFIMQALGMSFGEMTREVAASPYSRVFFFDDPSSDRYFWKMFLAGVVLLISMTGLDQDMMQRNLSCATPRDSQKNIVLPSARYSSSSCSSCWVCCSTFTSAAPALPCPQRATRYSRWWLSRADCRYLLAYCLLWGLFRVLIQLPVRRLRPLRLRSRSTSCKAPGATVTNALPASGRACTSAWRW